MYIVGLTGGIGSGKSTVAGVFQQLGIEIINADQISRDVVEPGSSALDSIAEHFGHHIITADGALDRKQLRQIIFSNTEEKKWLEELLHPLIFQEIMCQIKNAKSQYVILESPLLLETPQHKLVNRILVVDAPEYLQIQRTISRDQQTEEQVKAILAVQLTRQERCKKADDIIVNDKDLENIAIAVEALHNKYIEYARRHKSK